MNPIRCGNHLCFNGGTCANGTCQCPSGFYGPECLARGAAPDKSVSEILGDLFEQTACSNCTFPTGQAPQLCFKKASALGVSDDTCVAFNLISADPKIRAGSVGFAGMMDTADVQPASPQSRFTDSSVDRLSGVNYCVGQSFGPEHLSNLQGILGDSRCLTTPDQCGPDGGELCSHGGLPCCEGLVPKRVGCVPYGNSAIGVWTCIPSPNCQPGFTEVQGKCYRDYPKPNTDWVAPCAPNNCPQGTDGDDTGACSAQTPAVNCGLGYEGCAWCAPCYSTDHSIHARCHDTLTIPYGSYYCNPDGWTWKECTDEAGCKEDQYWYMDPDDDTGNIAGKPPQSPSNGKGQVQYCQMPSLISG